MENSEKHKLDYRISQIERRLDWIESILRRIKRVVDLIIEVRLEDRKLIMTKSDIF